MSLGPAEVLRSAVIGCGIVGRQRHIPALELNPRTDLVAICDQREDALREVAVDTDASTYTSVDEMIAAESLDSVHICTPPQTRVSIAEKIAPEGVAILFEKPVADTVDSVNRLQQLSDEHAVTMTVVHNKLFTPHYREAKNRIQQGEIGEVVAVTMLFGETTDPGETPRGDWVYKLPGGEIGEGLPHQAYLPLAFVDKLGEITCVSKQQFGSSKAVGFDGVSFEATDPSGQVLVTLRVLTNSTAHDRLIVNGTEGELTVDHHRKGVFNTTTGGADAKSIVIDSLQEAAQLGWNVVTTGTGFAKRLAYRRVDDERSEEANGHYVLINEHIKAVQTGSEPPVTLEEGKETIQFIEALT